MPRKTLLWNKKQEKEEIKLADPGHSFSWYKQKEREKKKRLREKVRGR